MSIRSIGAAVAAFVVFVTWFTASAGAQGQAAEISGRIVSARDGEALGLAQVVLAGTAFSAVTDATGAFRITGVPAGTYALQASVVGYRVIEQMFALAAGESKTFEITLTPNTITLTDSTVVIAGSGPEPRSREWP